MNLQADVRALQEQMDRLDPNKGEVGRDNDHHQWMVDLDEKVNALSDRVMQLETDVQDLAFQVKALSKPTTRTPKKKAT